MLLLAVSYPTPDGSRTDVVQVPLSIRRSPLAGRNQALIGRVSIPDPAGSGGRRRRGRARRPVGLRRRPRLRIHRRVAGADAPRRHHAVRERSPATSSSPATSCPRATGVVKVLSGEQSNSSVIVDDGKSAAILKFFRVLSEGQNPEVEIGAALTAGRTVEVPATLGWVTGEWDAPTGARPRPSRARRTGRGARVPRRRTGCLAAGRQRGEPRPGLHRRGTRARRRHRHGAPPAGRGARRRLRICPGQRHRARRRPARAAVLGRRPVPPSDLTTTRWTGSSCDSKAAAPGPLQRIHGDLHLGQILQVPGGRREVAALGHPRFRGRTAAADFGTQFPGRPAARRRRDAAVLRLRRRRGRPRAPGRGRPGHLGRRLRRGLPGRLRGRHSRQHRPRFASLRGAVARQGTLRSHLRATEQAGLALHSGQRITSSPRQYRLRRSGRSRSGRYQNDRFSTYRSSRKPTPGGRGDAGEGRRRRTPRPPLGPGRAPR